MTVEKLAQDPLDFSLEMLHTTHMKKTTNLSAIMADYTAQVRAEERRRQAIRDGRLPAPQGQWGRWDVSDRD